MQFPKNEIISLLDDRLEWNLAESTNKDLIMKEIWNEDFEKGLRNLKLEYGTSQGSAELRSLIGSKLGVHQDHIVITNGAAFANFLAILTLCERGDEVITVQPNFPPTMDLIEGLGFQRKLLQLSFDNSYQIKEEALFSEVTDRTKLIILVSPLNPTGTSHAREKIKHIAKRLSKEYPNCKLLIDETYREATYGINEVIPTFAGLHDNIMTVSSLSKCHGTPGLRIGWLYANDADLIQSICLAKMNTVISNSVLDEYVALHVLKNEDQLFQSRRIHSAQGLDLTRKWIEENAEYLEWNEPSAGALCCVRLKESHFDESAIDAFYKSVKEASIQIANGEWFGEYKRYFRLGFGYMEIEQLEHTLKELSKIVRTSFNYLS